MISVRIVSTNPVEGMRHREQVGKPLAGAELRAALGLREHRQRAAAEAVEEVEVAAAQPLCRVAVALEHVRRAAAAAAAVADAQRARERAALQTPRTIR